MRAVPYPVQARRLQVTRAHPLSATMRRIVLAGADLEPTFPFPPLGSADHVKLLLPDPVTGQVTLPGVRTGAGGPELRSQTPPVLREYTVRRVDHHARELAIDFGPTCTASGGSMPITWKSAATGAVVPPAQSPTTRLSPSAAA
jgi:NADPH-dependent ferric siderophore reductase